MANYDFGMFTVLVVEDNHYMRTMLRALLYAVGVGNVLLVKDGEEATELLRKIKENPVEAGVSTVDLIFSNWQMAPVDGAMLLKWVRRSKDSPDRFVPFVMVSGYGDVVKVAEARDLGATEFLAKPYSIDGLVKRIMVLVDRPRQFVLTPEYFGPDRRRQAMPRQEPDRRVTTEADIEIIYDDR